MKLKNNNGLRPNSTMLNRLENEMKAIESAVEGLVAMEDSMKVQGGDAIRAFYAGCHLLFLQFFMTFESNYVNILTQMDSALDALEPNEKDQDSQSKSIWKLQPVKILHL
ncbi:T7SS effector LXG polymorphic toxin [Sporosarcina psychrophila]|uniref:Ribonuclease toxin of YeeF-YezG toxin-antitoxin module n=1 Tax=Sporosarcina psychrophila TaxID=1476 RepID=A0ABV2K8I3_SPOPS